MTVGLINGNEVTTVASRIYDQRCWRHSVAVPVMSNEMKVVVVADPFWNFSLFFFFFLGERIWWG